jgi:formylglycine-generating enzyme required for sulfatase activity
MSIIWCEVPKGEFVMGEDDEQHAVTIPCNYKVAKHPVTNAQYDEFVNDGGYTDKWRHCWTEAGWQRKERENWQAPRQFGEPFDFPSYPIVGVSWYEAVAFCRWLTEQLRERGELDKGQVIRLPTEAEWEKAARGTDGRAYPWGNEPDVERMNCNKTGAGSTSAIGCLPTGASPYGCLDMAGNVWEWCATKYGKGYPYDVSENEWTNDYLTGTDARRLRGGSWNFNLDSCRSACRGNNNPFDRVSNDGFRLLCSHF